ncbi:MAG: Grx4 family monothiol glutaredoxin [Myxococcota bacterium]
MELDKPTRERIDKLITAQPVTLFMKGDRQQPRCGFSATVVEILDSLLPDYQTVDVLDDPAIREGVKLYSSWPTIPQLYVRGELVGGCDIIRELFASGELHQTLGLDRRQAEPPELRVTDAAAEALRQATAGRPEGEVIHLSIDSRFQTSLSLGPLQAGDLEVETAGLRIAVDALSAPRAQGVVIDAVQTDDGPAFRIDNPNAPNPVQAMDVGELKRRLGASEVFELLDVRTAEERALASIPGSVLLNEDVARRLESLPRDTMLVFHCHHGGRSQAAAEHFAALGFRNVWNVIGGIDAWSQQVDPEVPRY